jgi:hypothetical protein
MPLGQPSSVAIQEENVAGRKMRGVGRHHLENVIADSSILEKWSEGISSPKLLPDANQMGKGMVSPYVRLRMEGQHSQFFPLRG